MSMENKVISIAELVYKDMNIFVMNQEFIEEDKDMWIYSEISPLYRNNNILLSTPISFKIEKKLIDAIKNMKFNEAKTIFSKNVILAIKDLDLKEFAETQADFYDEDEEELEQSVKETENFYNTLKAISYER